MYRLIKHSWIRGSDQNFGNVVGVYPKKREAYGQLKAHLNSHIEHITKHDFVSWEYDAIKDQDSILILDGIEPKYMFWYEIDGLDEVKEPSKPKINLIKELEKLLDEFEYDKDTFYYRIEDLIDRVKAK